VTERIYTTQAYERTMQATVIDSDPGDGSVLLDRTVFYPGGGGQPHDLGTLTAGAVRYDVVRVSQDDRGVWHWIDGTVPAPGTDLIGELDWQRRHLLMRTHTAMHTLTAVIWKRFQSPATGGNMKPGEGRLDFEIPQWTAEDRPAVEAEFNRQLALDYPLTVSFLDRSEADKDPSLIRTKVSLLPPSLKTVRVVDIVGLDRQADGGTHVASTAEVGRVRITKAESKGKGFRRLRFVIEDGTVAG
jgi:misacylated tRNA(Ala) deacylase